EEADGGLVDARFGEPVGEGRERQEQRQAARDAHQQNDQDASVEISAVGASPVVPGSGRGGDAHPLTSLDRRATLGRFARLVKSALRPSWDRAVPLRQPHKRSKRVTPGPLKNKDYFSMHGVVLQSQPA